MHSVWSDGAESIESLIQGCLARGYTYCGITDHSYGLPIARGMSMEAVDRQHREIDRLNRLYDGRFRVVKSIEANIRADGSLDLSADEVRRFELVLASPHSQLRTAVDQTPRLLAIIDTPGIHILGHPRGRMFDSRPGLAADWDAVFAAAARASVAVEIDGDRSRQDLDWTLARQALRAGCLLALDSDAHGSSELEMATWAVAHARLAGAPPDRVINTWTVDRLLTWAARQTAT